MTTSLHARRQAIAVALVAALAVSGLGVLSTDIGSWYAGLREPTWKPSDALFGPVWTLIYACVTVAALRVWWAIPNPDGRGVRDPRLQGERQRWLGALALNATLNVFWSLLFFRLRRPDWALLEVVLLWASILVLILLASRRDVVAACLLVPYLAWVSFAAILDRAVVQLNGPFGSA